MKKIYLPITAVILISLFFLATESYGFRGTISIGDDSIIGPNLWSPVTHNIILAGKDVLEFKWERRNLARTDHFEFRLYKGYKTVADTLILKEDIPSDTYPFALKASLFEVGQVYTWSLRQVFHSGQKSDRSFSSFKIIQK